MHIEKSDAVIPTNGYVIRFFPDDVAPIRISNERREEREEKDGEISTSRLTGLSNNLQITHITPTLVKPT